MGGAAIKAEQFLIIIGAAKCATTSLFDYLSQHPAVCASITKEPDYFLERRQRFPGVRHYEDFWPDFDQAVHRFALEGSTHYTMRGTQRGVPERMLAYGIQPRLIYVVRDPVKRIESHVNYKVMYSRERASFEDPCIIDASRYSRQLEPYVGAFGSDAIRVVDFNDLCQDPNQVCANIYSWLGIEAHVVDDLVVSNESASVKTSHLERVEALKRFGRRLPPRVNQPVKKLVKNILPYRHKQILLPPDSAERIRESLREDIMKFAREWNVDILSWGFDTPDDQARQRD